MEAICGFPSSAKAHEKKGTLHISMLSYRPCSYAANGMFVGGDAKLFLETEGVAGLKLKTLAVRPVAWGEHDMHWMGT